MGRSAGTEVDRLDVREVGAADRDLRATGLRASRRAERRYSRSGQVVVGRATGELAWATCGGDDGHVPHADARGHSYGQPGGRPDPDAGAGLRAEPHRGHPLEVGASDGDQVASARWTRVRRQPCHGGRWTGVTMHAHDALRGVASGERDRCRARLDVPDRHRVVLVQANTRPFADPAGIRRLNNGRGEGGRLGAAVLAGYGRATSGSDPHIGRTDLRKRPGDLLRGRAESAGAPQQTGA